MSLQFLDSNITKKIVRYEKKIVKTFLRFFFFHLEFVETSCSCHFKSYQKHAPSLFLAFQEEVVKGQVPDSFDEVVTSKAM